MLQFYSKDLLGEDHLFDELDAIRTELDDLLDKINRSEGEDLTRISRDLDDRLRRIATRATVFRLRGRAAIETIKSFYYAANARETEKKARIEEIPPEISVRLFGDAVNFRRWKEMVDLSGYIKADKDQVLSATRIATQAINRAARDTRIRKMVRLCLNYIYFIFWSLVLLGVIVEYSFKIGEHLVRELLKGSLALLSININENNFLLDNALIVFVIIVSWPLLELYIRPKLDRSQKMYEKYSVKCYASDVLNADFTVRAYRVLVEATRAAALNRLNNVDKPPQIQTENSEAQGPFIPQFIFKRPPSIDFLRGFGPLLTLAQSDAPFYAE
jgi:hypothetical protein